MGVFQQHADFVMERMGSKITPPRRQLVLPPPKLDEEQFRFCKVVVDGLRSGGRIELFEDQHNARMVAAKRLPRAWTLESPEAFALAHPDLLESPWKEIEVLMHLAISEVPAGICPCYGAFCDPQGDILILSEYFPRGDLHDFASRFLCTPGHLREEKAWPILISLLRAVEALHDAGVAHGDISLENVLLGCDGKVRLIDYEAAVTESPDRAIGSRGKPSYQAPEMHGDGAVFDARAADLFACGVLAYCLAIGDYPWKSTRPGCCKGFDHFQKHGLQAFLRQRRLKLADGAKGSAVAQVLSPELQNMLSILLDPVPARRKEAFFLASEQGLAEATESDNSEDATLPSGLNLRTEATAILIQ